MIGCVVKCRWRYKETDYIWICEFGGMVSSCISNSRYTYIHGSKWPNEAVDVHQVIVKKSGAKGFLVYFFALAILANAFHLFLVKVCPFLLFDIFLYKGFVLLFKSLFLRSSLPYCFVDNKHKLRSIWTWVSLVRLTCYCCFLLHSSYWFIGKTCS